VFTTNKRMNLSNAVGDAGNMEIALVCNNKGIG
jgi:hypothetical protein